MPNISTTRSIFTILLLLGVTVNSTVSANPLSDFTIVYTVENNFLTAGTATFQLRQQSDKSARLTFVTTPSGLFRLSRQGRIQEGADITEFEYPVLSQRYFHDNLSKPERSFRIEFDRDNRQSTLEYKGQSTTMINTQPTVDRLSLLLSLMIKLRDEKDLQQISMPLLDKSGVRRETFMPVRTEQLETALGSFDSQVLSKKREGSNKYELIWFAKLNGGDLPYPVQFEQYKEGSLVVRLRLEKFN